MSSNRKRLYLPAAELRLILAGSGLLCILLVLNSQTELWAFSLLQALLGIVYALCVPGYLFQLSMFPRREDLNWDGRLALSFGLSIAIVAPLALVLDQFEAGLGLVPYTTTWVGLILLLVIIAAIRQMHVRPDQRAGLRWELSLREVWQGESKSGRRLLILLSISLLVGLSAGIGLAILPAPGSTFTEFYILGEEGMAELYPYTIELPGTSEITVGVRNLEGEDHYYHVEAWDASGLVGSSLPFVVRDGAGTEFPLAFKPGETGEDVKISFFLLLDGGSTPYRMLHLYTRIVPRD
jgi:uncharacterized membrane protein